VSGNEVVWEVTGSKSFKLNVKTQAVITWLTFLYLEFSYGRVPWTGTLGEVNQPFCTTRGQ
jgi:hypothetical protein